MKSIETKTLPLLPLLLLLLLGGSAGAFLGGCSFLRPHDDPTRFYVLTGPPALTARLPDGEFKQLRMGLKPVEVAAYLRTKSIVVRTGTNEIQLAEFDRWAEPLSQGIGRVIMEDLRSARNVASVTLNSHGGNVLDYEVALQILACEGVRGEHGTSAIRFAASWEIRAVGTNALAPKLGGFTAGAVPWGGKDYGQLAERLSEALAAASIALAADLPREAMRPPQATSPAHP